VALYGAQLELELIARLREEKKFGSVDELKKQIWLDIAEARRLL
jgi:riboflavin kinase / FMN adenylyltransferase